MFALLIMRLKKLKNKADSMIIPYRKIIDNTKDIFSIILLAALSNFVWLKELLNNGWGGLEWISNNHYSLYIIPLLFIIWLCYISISLKVKIHPVFYSIIYVIFFYISMKIFYVQMSAGPAALMMAMYFLQYLPFFIVKNFFIVCALLEVILIFILDIIICLYEIRKITIKDIIIISLHIIIIPVFLILISYIILLYTHNYDKYCIDPIHWFKTGSIIFSFVIYECSYIYYIKKKRQKGVNGEIH